jgi:uncharacterized protein (TIGR00661 family)
MKHYLSKGFNIIILTYGHGLSFFKNELKNIEIVEVANPYYVGDKNGLNFKLTAEHPLNQVNFELINSKALSKIVDTNIKLVISDYEMVSAKYAYLKNIPLITIDQQSKFLIGNFPQELNGTSYKDEVERLSLFFPKAYQRIAISFFKVIKDKKSKYKVDIIAPNIDLGILKNKEDPFTILVYISGQIKSEIKVEEWIKLLKQQSNYRFHLFIKNDIDLTEEDNIKIYPHNDINYIKMFEKCSAIISTAGHSLISEAIYYEKPIYAIPLNLYEQQINADKIKEGKFGTSSQQLEASELEIFLMNITKYKKNIQKDNQILLKRSKKSIYTIINSIIKRTSKD